MPVPPSDSDVDLVDFRSTPERTIHDLTGYGPLLALGRYRYLRARPPLAPQRHDSLLVLALPVKGDVAFVVDDDPRTVRPGQALRIPPGRSYRTGVPVQPRGELVWLLLRTGPESDLSTGPLHRAVAALSAPRGPDQWAVPDLIPGELRRLDNAGAPGDWLTTALLEHRSSVVVLELARSLERVRRETTAASAPPRPGPAPVHPAVADALAWLEEHLSEPCGVQDLIEVSGLSEGRFYRMFREGTGTTPKDYLLRRKTALAYQWMRTEPDVTVSRVAHTLGFSSSQYFATVFRRYHGFAPTTGSASWRNQLRG
ncbi:AraC family transcriptional regulator (plasmid) [Embleya sp. NBC_00888]|uniref:AraC family transcriptional regulator n=1 Tax=Embleya sp. NBC_00888 TaxID=2975960 RepID=UPI002F9166BF|nr:AraC family transcriptional regulator [Embleya sp. NBC_00888]